VIVATVRSLKMNGGVARGDLAAENLEALQRGCANLGRHIENVKLFGVPPVVAINHFVADTEAEIAAVQAYVAGHGVEAILCRHWAQGGAGAEDLARKVAAILDTGDSAFRPLYADDLSLFAKIETVARRIYRADRVSADRSVMNRLARWRREGFGELPVCMAKTQYSFSIDPERLGAPTGHELRVRDVRLAAGAGFVVAICGDIMTMPGLPRRPAAVDIGIDGDGEIFGLF
jgi:formate--tetrahydrofolate ligase